ncbi:MAG: MraY family glycosyltransferase [Rickettsiales bacterium]
MNNIELIYSFTLALFLTIAAIPVLIKISGRLQLIDAPTSDRKVHDKEVPRSGGLGIFLGAMLPMFFLLDADRQYLGIVIASTIIVIFGFLDDRFELNFKWKFLGQILAVIVVMMFGVTIDKMPFANFSEPVWWISYPLTFFFLLGVTNAVNLADGLDGLAAGTILISLALLTVLAFMCNNLPAAMIAISVIGGVMGFLRYNTYPAQIFMGDAGSQFLGFISAALALVITQAADSAVSPALPLLILGLPIMDTLMVMTIRIYQGRSPFSPDKFHLHHRLLALGLRHYEVVGVIYILHVSLIVIAYLLRFQEDALIVGVFIAYSGVIYGLLWGALKFGWVFRNYQFSNEGIERRNMFLRKFDWYYIYSSFVIEYAVAFFLVVAALLIGPIQFQFAVAALILAVVLVLTSFAVRSMPMFSARLCCYSASVYVVYLLSQTELSIWMANSINIFLVVLAVALMLGIRMTRRQDFRLDTQDLLVLLMLLAIPQLPFDTLTANSIGEIALRLAVLMYCCEFLLGRGLRRYSVLKFASVASLGAIGLTSLLI